jgi:hypothetical protein
LCRSFSAAMRTSNFKLEHCFSPFQLFS